MNDQQLSELRSRAEAFIDSIDAMPKGLQGEFIPSHLQSNFNALVCDTKKLFEGRDVFLPSEIGVATSGEQEMCRYVDLDIYARQLKGLISNEQDYRFTSSVQNRGLGIGW